jgi:hypothetical protein
MPTIYRDLVTVNGTVFNNPNLPFDAISAGIDVMDGWDNTPDPEVLSTDLANTRDGSADADYWPIRAKFVTLAGWVYCPSRAYAKSAKDQLVALFPRNREFIITREDYPAKMIQCRRSSGFEFDWPVPDGFRWQTTVRADDPFLYSVNPSTYSGGPVAVSAGGFTFPLQFPLQFAGTVANSGGIYALNNGTSPTRKFSASITGPLTRGAWRLRNDTNGGEIAFDTGVLSTDVLTIDFSSRRAYLNGYSIDSKVIGDFWTLDPVVNAVRLYAEYAPTINVTLTVYSAWE